MTRRVESTMAESIVERCQRRGSYQFTRLRMRHQAMSIHPLSRLSGAIPAWRHRYRGFDLRLQQARVIVPGRVHLRRDRPCRHRLRRIGAHRVGGLAAAVPLSPTLMVLLTWRAIVAAAACVDHLLDHQGAIWIIHRCDGRLPNLRLDHEPGKLAIRAAPVSGAHLTTVDPWFGLHDAPDARGRRGSSPIRSC